MQRYFYTSRLACCMLTACFVALAAGCEQPERASKPRLLDPEVHGLLERMNALARETKAEREFRYDLAADCTLTAERVVAGRPGQRRDLPLGTTPFARFEYAPGLGYGLRAPIAGTSAMESIFDARSIETIETMETMLQSLEQTCLQTAERARADPRYAYTR